MGEGSGILWYQGMSRVPPGWRQGGEGGANCLSQYCECLFCGGIWATVGVTGNRPQRFRQENKGWQPGPGMLQTPSAFNWSGLNVSK